MEVLRIVLSVLLIIDCIVCAIVVLMQEGKEAGLGALTGSTDTYWSKNKGRSVEGMLANITKICAALFIVLSLALNLKWLR